MEPPWIRKKQIVAIKSVWFQVVNELMLVPNFYSLLHIHAIKNDLGQVSDSSALIIA